MNKASIPAMIHTLLWVFILTGCSSGGGGGGDGPEVVDSPLLSITSAYPGEYITVSDESIRAGQASMVSFKNGNGYDVSFTVEDTADGIARFPVPIFIDPATGSRAGAVTVSVGGKQAQGSLSIKALSDVGVPAGEVYVVFLQKTIDELTGTSDHLRETIDEESMDFLEGTITGLDEKIDGYQAMIDQIRNTRTLTLTTHEGKQYTLDEDDLKMLDQWLTTWILGMEAAMRGPSPMNAQGLNMDNWLEISGEERLQRIRDSIDYTLDEFKRGVEGGKVYMGGMSLAFAGAGFLVGGPVGAIIGGAAGLAFAYVQAGYELGTAAIFERMCESFSQKSREAYDWSRGILNQAISIATSGLSTLENKIGDLFNLIDTAMDTKDVMDAAENMRCNDEGRSLGTRGPAPYSAEFTISEFCGDSPPDDIIPDVAVLSAQIEIEDSVGSNDYSRYLAYNSPEHVIATFSSIEDGEGTIILGNIPSILCSDAVLSSEGGVFDEDTLVIMISPDLAGPFPDIIDVGYDLLDAGIDAMITFHTPSVRNDTPLNDVVIFSSVSGTINLEAFGTDIGYLIKGSFSVDIEGDLDHWDYVVDDYDYSDLLTGTITGTFEGILTEAPAQ